MLTGVRIAETFQRRMKLTAHTDAQGLRGMKVRAMQRSQGYVKVRVSEAYAYESLVAHGIN
jgi:hypothetical protein